MAQSHSTPGAALREKIAEIIVWSSGKKRAPHKPLLLLFAIGSVQRGESRLQPFADVEPILRSALLAFGPVRKSIHPEYPFWHLKTNEIWEIASSGEVALRRGSINPSGKQLRDKCAKGGLLPTYFEALKDSPELQADLIHDILDTHFPSSLHEDIINFFRLRLRREQANPSRDLSLFRQRVLAAYDGACAISNFSVRMDDSVSLGVEATHLLWPQAGGENLLPNAVAMTTLHRRLFHLGVFTIDSTYRVRISKSARGTSGFTEMLGQFDGKKISLPADVSQHPDQQALIWHREQVFRR